MESEEDMISLFKPRMEPGVKDAVSKVLYSGFIGQGQKVEEFEKALIPWVGRETILTTNSCTSALTLALHLSGVGRGHEVISTPMTCAATNTPIVNAGAKVIWADVSPVTGLIDPEDVRRKITCRTKAVVCVHYGGRPCDLDALRDICKEKGLKLIEDAAHALGARYNGTRIGSHGDFACFSFQAIKHLTTVDGGLLSCKSKKDYERAKLLRWYGIRRPSDLTKNVSEAGYKFHMNDVNAVIGLENLKGLKHDLFLRRTNAFYYSEVLSFSSARWLFIKHVKNRRQFIYHMAKQGVQVGTVHERNDKYTMFRGSNNVHLPGVDEFCKTQVAIPVGPHVTEKDRIRIIRAMRGW
jgi:perosamine synthetase